MLKMTSESHLNMGKYFEWYTELPFSNWSRESPALLIRNTECYFHLARYLKCGRHYYGLYLKPKTTVDKLESLSFKIAADYQSPGTFGSFSSATFKNSETVIHSFCEQNISDRGPNFGVGYFITFYFMFKNEDGLVLLLESGTDEKSTQADLMLSFQTDVEYLSLDFGELLKTGNHSDVQLLCNGGNIPAHKAVLAARSKAFSDMFQDCTEENKSGLINLTTTDKSVMELCLEFIYKGKISNFPVHTASSLYVLGHVLKISSLTKMCADQMVSNLCEDNYISNLILADKYDDEYFKCGLIDYICEHTELLKSESWVKFSDEHMKTAIDVYRKCMFK